MVFNNRSFGFTLVELLVTVSIIGLLVGMLLPAVQAVRESARRTVCKNNLRQMALACLNFESAHGHIPGPLFNADMTLSSYTHDSGFFVNIAPFMEVLTGGQAVENIAYNGGELATATVQPTPEAMLCPSSRKGATELEFASLRFSGEAEDFVVSTCDYTGNGGAVGYDPSRRFNQGPIAAKICGISNHVSLGKVTDGASNTFLLWESYGSERVLDRDQNEYRELNSEPLLEFQLTVNPDGASRTFFSSGAASSKSYLYSWGGLRIGNLDLFGGNSLGSSNSLGQPFSFHARGSNFSRVDGSVQFINNTISSGTLHALGGIADGSQEVFANN